MRLIIFIEFTDFEGAKVFTHSKRHTFLHRMFICSALFCNLSDDMSLDLVFIIPVNDRSWDAAAWFIRELNIVFMNIKTGRRGFFYIVRIWNHLIRRFLIFPLHKLRLMLIQERFLRLTNLIRGLLLIIFSCRLWAVYFILFSLITFLHQYIIMLWVLLYFFPLWAFPFSRSSILAYFLLQILVQELVYKLFDLLLIILWVFVP